MKLRNNNQNTTYYTYRKLNTSRDTLSSRDPCWRQRLKQSELIGQWATPHHRRLGGIGRVVPIEIKVAEETISGTRSQLIPLG